MATQAPTKLAALEAACRAQGVPLTVQRRAILEVLADRTDHPTADQVFAAVRISAMLARCCGV